MQELGAARVTELEKLSGIPGSTGSFAHEGLTPMPMWKVPDAWLLVSCGMLVTGGLFMVGSSTSYFAMVHYDAPQTLFLKHMLHLVVGVLAGFVAYKIKYRKLEDQHTWIRLLYVISVVSLIVVFFMPSAGGAHRWLVFGPVRIQPSELTKLFVVLFMARAIARNHDRINDLWSFPIPALLVVGPLAALIVAEPDLGSAVILVAIPVVQLFVAGLRRKYFAWLGLIGAVGLAVSILVEPFRLQRIVDYVLRVIGVRPPSYQILQSWIALGSGGLTGLGLGESKQKALFLPAAHTDFIFSIVGEETGLLGTLLIVIGFLLILWRGIRTATRLEEPFGAYLAIGLTYMIVLQAFGHIGVCLGLLPTTGLPLPFISYGGSSLVVSSAAVGLLLNLSQDTNIKPGLAPKPGVSSHISTSRQLPLSFRSRNVEM